MPPRRGDSSPEAEQLNAANLRALDHFGISFQPKDTEADDSELRSAANSLGTFAMRVLGRSDDLGGQFGQVPQDFTEAVAWDIHDQANYNDGLWQDTAYAVNFSQKETESWADQVEEFLGKRTKLIEEWESAVDTAVTRKNTLIDEVEVPLDLTPEGRKKFNENVEERAADTARAELEEDREALRTRDKNNHDTLLDEAEAHGDRLAEGPTPDNVERLINTGYMNWSGFNIKGEEAALPVTPERAERDARILGQYMGDDADDPDLEYHAALALLQSLGSGSAAFQNSKSRNAAIEYLETLFGDLENQAGPTGLPQYLSDGNNLTAPELRPLADGILTLSDTDKGGSFYALPQSIQNVALGPGQGNVGNEDNASEYKFQNWESDVPGFARIMRASDPDLQGGEAFSLYMTSTIGGHVLGFDDNVIDDLEADLGSLLDISTRNEDANHGLLTGKGGQHPSIDREDAIAGIFTHDWKDDGESAAKLVDWIHEDACDPDAIAAGSCDPSSDKHERAGDAMYGLIETITTGDLEEQLRNTGIETDGVEKSAFTRVNPEIGESLTNGYLTFLNDFSVRNNDPESTGYGALNNTQARSSPFHEDGDVSLKVTGNQKQDFLQFLVADETQATRVSIATQGQEQSLMGATLDGDVTADNAARSAGELRGAFDSALVNEYNDQLENVHAARDKARTALEAGRIGLSTMASSFGGPAGAGGTMFVGTLINDQVVEPAVGHFGGAPSNPDNYSTDRESVGDSTLVDREAVSNHVMLQAGHAVIAREDLTTSHLAEFGEDLVNKDGELPLSTSGWEGGGDPGSIANKLKEILTGESARNTESAENSTSLPSTNWKNSPSGDEMEELLEDYRDEYEIAYDGMVNDRKVKDSEDDPN